MWKRKKKEVKQEEPENKTHPWSAYEDTNLQVRRILSDLSIPNSLYDSLERNLKRLLKALPDLQKEAQAKEEYKALWEKSSNTEEALLVEISELKAQLQREQDRRLAVSFMCSLDEEGFMNLGQNIEKEVNLAATKLLLDPSFEEFKKRNEGSNFKSASSGDGDTVSADTADFDI